MSHNTNGQETIDEKMATPSQKSNGMGTAGFVLALVGLFLGWIPFLGWIVWLLGLIFSSIGIFRKPNGLAIAGLVISLAGVLLIFFVFANIVAMN